MRQDSPPNTASTKDTTGLKWPPDTGPNIRMIANSPAAVAAAFSNSSSPVSPGDSRWAAMPEPITTAARNALPEELGQQPARQIDRIVHGPGFVARTIAPCIPGTASWVNSTLALTKPAEDSPSRYSLWDKAPATHPT